MYPVAEVSALDMAFPASVLNLMPAYSAIPAEFKNRHHKMVRLFSEWFFLGLESLELVPREGVDEKKALRHLRTIMGSYEPKQEHKEAGVAYLLDQWFSDAKWETKKREQGK